MSPPAAGMAELFWYQNNSAIPAAGGDITLRQEIVAIRNGLPPPQGKLWQRLADHQVQIGVHLEERLPIAVDRRNGDAVHPFISRLNLGAETRHLGGNSCPKSMALC